MRYLPRGIYHLTKERAIHVAVNSCGTEELREELRMVKHMESFQTKLQSLGFSNLCVKFQLETARVHSAKNP
jgi:hypothetical protein